MIRFFLEQVAALEMALLIMLAVTIFGASVAFILWLRVRKSRRHKPAGTA